MPELLEAHLRHAVYYLQRVQALDAASNREKSRLFFALNSLDQDWSNFQVGYAWAKSKLLLDNKAASLCSMYPARVPNLLILRQNPRERLDWHKIGLKAAKMLGLSQNIGTHLAGIGLAFMAMGMFDKAIDVLDQLVDFARRTADHRLLAVGTLNLAIAWTGLGQLQRGCELGSFSFSVFRVLQDTSGRTRALGTQATAFAAMGKHRRAVRCFDACLQQHRSEQDVFLESGTLVNIGVSLSALGDYAGAVDVFNQALVIVEQIGDITSKSRILGNLANIHLSQGNQQNAFACFEAALNIQQTTGDQRGEAATLSNLATIYMSIGNLDLAAQLLESSRLLLQQMGLKKELAILLANLGLLNLSRENHQFAADLLEQAYDASSSIGDEENAANSLVNLGIALRHLGKLDEALSASNKALAIYEDQKNLRGKTFAYTNLGMIYGLKDEHQRALEFYTSALNMDVSAGDRQGEAINRIHIAEELRQQGKLEEAIAQAKTGLEIMDEIGYPRAESIRKIIQTWKTRNNR